MVDRVGQRFGDYRLTRFLGRGSFGEVYLGEDVREHTLAAVKLLQARLTAQDLRDFINEANTLLRLRHPNVVHLLGFGIEDDTPFLAMAYAPNGTLLQRHPRGTRLPLATIVTYVKQIAAALQYAHDQRRIHRDVKPANMLFGATNEILLSDFGIAVVAHNPSSQRQEDAIGTADYMAPEQWQGRPLPATDQYALGIIVYEWLCGECPFRGNRLQLMYQHLQTPPPPLRGKVPTISPGVEQVMMMALDKDPKQRFGSVQEFASALEQAYESGPAVPPLTTAAPPQPPSPPTTTGPTQSPVVPSKPSRRKVVLVGIVGLVVVGSGLALWGHLPFRSSQMPTPIPQGMLLYTYSKHTDLVSAVAWSPEGKHIASGSYDKTVQVWDAANGNSVFTYHGHAGHVNAVSWSPDGTRLASASNDKTVQVWDAANGGNVYIYRGHTGVVLAVAWSSDGKHIASGSLDKTVQVWDAANGGHVYSYPGHANSVDTVAWSPDGKRIASGSFDKTVQVWEAV